MATIQEILLLSPNDIIATLTKEPDGVVRPIAEWQEQYNPATHKVQTDTTSYPDKEVPAQKNTDGSIIKAGKTVPVARESIADQQNITDIATAWLVGKPVELSLTNEAVNKEGEIDVPTKAQQEKDFKVLTALWDDLDLDDFNIDVVEATKRSSKSAEIWFVQPAIDGSESDQKGRIGVKLLSADSGDKFWPHYDIYGNMDAFTRQYTVLDEASKKVLYTVVYTAESEKTYQLFNDLWMEVFLENQTGINELQKTIGLIPAVYYDQGVPDWVSVQSIIEEQELSKSRLTNVVGYNTAPSMVFKGLVTNMPDKMDDAKTFQAQPLGEDENSVAQYADNPVQIVEWKQTPEMTKVEAEWNDAIIERITKTPNLSLSNLKGIGNPSGIMLQLLFLAPEIKALLSQRTFRPGFKARINIMLAILDAITAGTTTFSDIDIKITFQSILPHDFSELMSTLVDARGGRAIISQREASKRIPGIKDVAEEVEILGAEESLKSNIGPGSADLPLDDEEEDEE